MCIIRNLITLFISGHVGETEGLYAYKTPMHINGSPDYTSPRTNKAHKFGNEENGDYPHHKGDDKKRRDLVANFNRTGRRPSRNANHK